MAGIVRAALAVAVAAAARVVVARAALVGPVALAGIAEGVADGAGEIAGLGRSRAKAPVRR